jgi:hypothetical protein
MSSARYPHDTVALDLSRWRAPECAAYSVYEPRVSSRFRPEDRAGHQVGELRSDAVVRSRNEKSLD